MAGIFERDFGIRRAALGAAGLLLVPLSGGAQTVSPAPRPIVLDSKSASKLALNQARPEYPAIAKQNYIQGRVRVQIHVLQEGQVQSAHVVQGHPFLAASALEAVRRWRYRPLVTRSGPAEFLTLVELNFALRTRKIESVPRRPEEDLERQIRPPEIVQKPPQAGPASVRLRLLVDDKGRVIDSQAVGGAMARFEAGRRSVERWTFRPARWGSLPVPWYLDVDVPVEDPTPRHGAADPGNQ